MFDFDADDDSLEGITITDMSEAPYEDVRDACIKIFAKVCKDELAFDFNMVTKAFRTRLLEDPVYKKKTKALKAKMYIEQLSTLHRVANSGLTTKDGHDNTKNVLSALSSQNELMFRDLNEGDEDSMINIEFVSMTREEFEADPRVELHVGKNTNGSLSGGGEASKEEKFKEALEQKLKMDKELEDADDIGDTE